MRLLGQGFSVQLSVLITETLTNGWSDEFDKDY